MVKLLLSHGANISAEDDDKRTPLCFAAEVDKIEFVKVILETYGGEIWNGQCRKIINHKSKYGTAMDEAIGNDNNKEIIKILFEEYKCDSQGFKVAIEEGKMDIIDYYMEYMDQQSTSGGNSRMRADYEISYIFHEAILSGQINIVEHLLNTRRESPYLYGYDVTPLHIAASNKDIEMMRLLLENGATITIVESTISPLDCAAKSDCQEIVKLLLDKGIFNGNSRRRLMSSAIYYAVENGNLELVEFFLKEGVALRPSEDRESALYIISAKKGHLEIFKLLLAETLTQGGHVDDCDNELLTALHHVVRYGFKGFCDTMEEREIPPSISQDHKSRKEIIEVLLAQGADIDARDINGMTPLHHSANNSNYNSAAAVFLIKQGANFNVEKEEGLNLIQCIKIQEELEHDYWNHTWIQRRYDRKIKLAIRI